MAVLYILAGTNHFLNPDTFRKIMPPWLPCHDVLIYTTGVLEITFGVLLLPLATRRIGAWGIVFLLIAVFPANIQMALNYANTNHHQTWLVFLRLPVQALLIWWAWLFTQRPKREK